jgi:Putative glycolipid-binding
VAARRTLVWKGLDAVRLEICRAEVDRRQLRASGTQVGAEPEPYELRYAVEPGRLRLEVGGGASADLSLDGSDYFDLEFSPLFNSLPILEHGLDAGGEARDFVMSFVTVPALTVARSEQRYEPFGPGMVRFRSDDFTAMLSLDEDGFVVRYPGLAERVA